MEKENLIKKLEKIELPEIENPNHKRWLKMALISWMNNQKTKGRIFVWFKKPLIPLGSMVVIILICFIVNNLFIPQYTFAEATEIALNNPQIYDLLKEGNEIKDIKILKDKAYILISPEKYKEVKDEKVYSSLVEIELKKRKVSKIEKIEEIKILEEGF